MSEPFHIRSAVLQAIDLSLRNSGRSLPADPQDGDRLSDALGLDSLDFAVTVVELERVLGCDPFRQGGRSVRTLGDLVQLYEQAQRLQS